MCRVSRLESAIRRLNAQRICLDRAILLVAGLTGPVLEIGLGNGRTYDHLRQRLPRRAIFAFDRMVAAHPDCVPDAEHLILGELEETLPKATTHIGAPAALAHVDIGSGRPELDQPAYRLLARYLPALMAANGVVVSDAPIASAQLLPLELPPQVAAERYFMYRAHP